MSEEATLRYEDYRYLTTADFASAIRFVLSTKLEPVQIQVLSAELRQLQADR